MKRKVISIILIHLLFYCCVDYCYGGDDDVIHKIVQTNNGLVRGKQLLTLFDNVPYYAFKGIPYAKPPIGDLRFKVNSPWNWRWFSRMCVCVCVCVLRKGFAGAFVYSRWFLFVVYLFDFATGSRCAVKYSLLSKITGKKCHGIDMKRAIYVIANC